MNHNFSYHALVKHLEKNDLNRPIIRLECWNYDTCSGTVIGWGWRPGLIYIFPTRFNFDSQRNKKYNNNNNNNQISWIKLRFLPQPIFYGLVSVWRIDDWNEGFKFMFKSSWSILKHPGASWSILKHPGASWNQTRWWSICVAKNVWCRSVGTWLPGRPPSICKSSPPEYPHSCCFFPPCRPLSVSLFLSLPLPFFLLCLPLLFFYWFAFVLSGSAPSPPTHLHIPIRVSSSFASAFHRCGIARMAARGAPVAMAAWPMTLNQIMQMSPMFIYAACVTPLLEFIDASSSTFPSPSASPSASLSASLSAPHSNFNKWSIGWFLCRHWHFAGGGRGEGWRKEGGGRIFINSVAIFSPIHLASIVPFEASCSLPFRNVFCCFPLSLRTSLSWHMQMSF